MLAAKVGVAREVVADLEGGTSERGWRTTRHHSRTQRRMSHVRDSALRFDDVPFSGWPFSGSLSPFRVPRAAYHFLMAMTFDVTLKDMGRESPLGFLAAFDQPPALPVRLLNNVDFSTVTASADLILGLGDPLAEIVQIDFQSSASAWQHADVMAYHALIFAHYRVPVYTLIILLRPEAAHRNMNGIIHYAPRPGRGSMQFSYEIVRLWERPAEELLRAELGVVPLAMLGRLPEDLSLEDGLTVIAQRLGERITQEASPDRARKLLTDAYLLTGLRLRRDAAARIFRGVRAMQESDTYLAILDEGQEKATREDILVVGEERLGMPDASIKEQLGNVTHLDRLKRMHRRAVKAASWQEILDTP